MNLHEAICNLKLPLEVFAPLVSRKIKEYPELFDLMDKCDGWLPYPESVIRYFQTIGAKHWADLYFRDGIKKCLDATADRFCKGSGLSSSETERAETSGFSRPHAETPAEFWPQKAIGERQANLQPGLRRMRGCMVLQTDFSSADDVSDTAGGTRDPARISEAQAGFFQPTCLDDHPGWHPATKGPQ